MAAESTSTVRPTPARRPAGGFAQAVVFDLDGTLVDSYPLIEAAFARVMRTHHLDEAARELFRRSRGLPLPDQMKLISSEIWEELVNTYRQADAQLGCAQVFRGVPTLIRRLHRDRVGLGVVSSKRRRLVEAELEAIRLRPYFDVVIGYEDVTPPKPAPDPLLAAITQLGTPRSSSVYVGDSMVDLTTGRAARVRTVLAAWGLSPEMTGTFRGHRLRALHPREVIELLTTPNGNGHRAA